MKRLIFGSFIFFSMFGYAQTAPEKTFSENISGSETSNSATGSSETDLGGDMSLSVPLVTVVSKTMSIPVQLQYKAGVTVDQQSGPVGLGWAMPFGSIVRDYGAFEPDYTSVNSEIDMKNNSGGNDGWMQFPSPSTVGIYPYYNNHDFTYEIDTDLGDDGTSVPDEYHVSVPGYFSNTFFNKSGNLSSPREWAFQNDAPYKVDYTIKNFEIAQEFSRINEVNLGTTNMGDLDDKTEFDTKLSFAAAIGLLPIVEGGFLKVPEELSGAFNPTGDDRVVRYDDYETFTIVDDNGITYVFGRPLRAQKYILSEDPYWSVITKDASTYSNTQASMGNFWKIDFISKWLLTEIRNIDYVDQNGNGIADDGDLGDWIRIEYTEPTKLEATYLLGGGAAVYQEVPTHREWMNYSQTDRASSLMVENAYITKITTPLQEIDFTISERMEVDHDYYSKPANTVGGDPLNKHFYEDRQFLTTGSNTDFDIIYPVETMKYDEILVRDKGKDREYYDSEDLTLGKVELNYADVGSSDQLAVSNYLIRGNDNVDRLIDKPSEGAIIDVSEYYTATGRGKTTLLGVTFYPSNLDEDDFQEFTFEYDNNPSYDEIHKRSIVRKKFFPSTRQSSWSGGTLFDPVSLNNFTYDPEVGPIVSVNPFDFLIDFPYTESYETLSGLTHSQKVDYIEDNEVTPTGATVNTSNIIHPLYPVKDVLNYAINVDGTENKDAWSLTKINYPTGASTSFEYESDDFNISEDEIGWIIDETNIPLVKEYNDLARERARVQGIANELNLGDYNKTLTAAFTLDLTSSSGGIRLKSKTMDDGSNPPRVINYEYGEGHYTALPHSFVQNYYQGFTSFISRERKRHSWEISHYHVDYNALPGGWKNDFDVKMRYFAFNQVALDKVSSTHFYEDMSEVFANGSKIKKSFGFLEPDVPHIYDAHKVLYGRDIISTGKVKFIYSSEFNPFLGVDLVKIEKFEAGATDAYETISYEYQVSDQQFYEITSPVFPAPGTGMGGSDLYDNIFEVWVCLGGDGHCSGSPCIGKDPYEYNADFDVAVGAILISDFDPDFYLGYGWSDQNLVNFAPTFVNVTPVGPYYGFQIPAQFINRWGTVRKKAKSITTEQFGISSTVEFSYEPTYGYTSQTKTSGDFTNEIITDIEYGFQTYAGITTAFETSNLLRSVSRTTSYLNAVDNANTLSAGFIEWDYSGSFPRPLDGYQFETDLVDHATGTFTLVPYSVTSSNVANWKNVETEVLDRNADGKATLTRGNRMYAKTVVGYGRTEVKAAFQSVDGEFDATYSGFEDLDKPVDVIIQSLIYPEFWYNQDIDYVDQIVDAELLGLGADVCGNELTLTTSTGTQYLSLKIDDNFNSEGQIFFVGDQVTIDGTHSGGTAFPTFVTDITEIVTSDVLSSLIAPEVKFCLDATLPVEYATYYDVIDEITITKQKLEPESYPSKSYSRTGDYSYQLPNKYVHTGEDSKSTPIRPVVPPNNSLIVYDPVCFTAEIDEEERGYYPESCFINYEASVWLKYDYNTPRLEKSDGAELYLPYYSAYTGGFVTSTDEVTANDLNNTYLRGTVSETPASHDVKIVYKVWNAARTYIVDEGTFYPQDLSSQWKQYTVEIPLFRGAENLPIDVYVENNIYQGPSVSSFDRKSIYADDLLIYPQGADYTYYSFDKFRTATHATNGNDVYVSQQSDNWGRSKRSWNAFGDELSTIEYTLSNSATMDNSVTKTIWTDNDQYFKARTYMDGNGNEIQSMVSDPVTNKRIVSGYVEYDDMGWQVRSYKPYSLNGYKFSDTHDGAYVTQVSELYGSDYAYEEASYDNRVDQFPNSDLRPRSNVESPILTTTNKSTNLVAIGGIYDIPTYPIGDLHVIEITDPDGHAKRIYTDKMNRVILEEVEVGNEYIVNSDGTVDFSGSPKTSLKTWYKYDGLSRLIKSYDPDGKQTSYFYNSLGQSIKVTEPDRGTTESRFDKYGQLRFVKSEKDLEAISSPSVIDQFKYIKYDAWGRTITSGVMREMSSSSLSNSLGESYTPIVVFDDQSYVDNQDYPSDEQMFNQVNVKIIYDGTRAEYNSNSLLEERAYSSHSLNADYQYVATYTDATKINYLADGSVSELGYLYDEFVDEHVFKYKYSRFGNILEKRYEHPTDPTQNYTWAYEFDNFGRSTTASSGNGIDYTLTAQSYYDALGNKYKTGIGYDDDPLSPHIDYTIYKKNIRDESISKVSKSFRLGINYSPAGQITDQFWSAEHFDPTDGSTVDVNRYHYYYDQSDRLVGADYRSLSYTYNPFEYFDELASETYNEFNCTVNYESAQNELLYFLHSIDDIGQGGIGVPNPHKRQRAVDAIRFIYDSYLSSEFDWTHSSDTQKDDFLNELIINSKSNKVDMKAFEEQIAMSENDQAHLTDLQSVQRSNSAAWVIKGDVIIHSINNYGDIDPSKLKYSREALDRFALFQVASNCKVNPNATIYGFLPEFDQSGTETNGSIYDAAYWYHDNGNTEELWRKDNVGGYMNLSYTYGNPSKNLLTSVDWNNGTITTNSFTYDVLGNATYDQQNNNTLVYGLYHDLPVSMSNSSVSTEYRYNSGGNRTVKRVDGIAEFDLGLVKLNDDQSVKSYHYGVGYAVPNSDGTLEFRYTYSDWQGTIRQIIDEDGAIVSSRDHYPYGKHMPGRVFESDVEGKRYQFVGHEFDEEVNYGYHGARYYNRDLGRYLSIDPLTQLSPAWTPYHYAESNPIDKIDPDGRYVYVFNSYSGDLERVGLRGGEDWHTILVDYDYNPEVGWVSSAGSDVWYVFNTNPNYSLFSGEVYSPSRNALGNQKYTLMYTESDPWADIPEKFQGEYGTWWVWYRYNAKRNYPSIYNTILEQEALYDHRSEMMWTQKEVYDDFVATHGGDEGLLVMMVIYKPYLEALQWYLEAGMTSMKIPKNPVKFGNKLKQNSGLRSSADDVANNVVDDAAETSIQITKARFGHAFITHGEDATTFLINRAKGSGQPQGQFLNNQKAAQFILDNLDKIANGPRNIRMPQGFPGRVIMPDGTFRNATHIRLVPSGKGVKTAYPIIPGL